MLAVIGNALGFACIIIVGWTARRLHLVDREVKRVLPNLMLCITLPASIISNCNGCKISPSDLYILGLGCLFNATALILAWIVGRRNHLSSFLMVSTAGFNIGCFAMPFVQGMLPAQAVMQASLFDIGNSLMCLGLNYGIVAQAKEAETGGDGRLDVPKLLGVALRSVPVIAYLAMLALCLLRIELPVMLVNAAGIAGRANPFIAMMVIGTSIEFVGKDDIGDGAGGRYGVVFKACALRLLHSAASAAVVVVLPLPAAVKCVVTCLVFAPIGAVSSVYAHRLRLDDGLAACINSCYVPISIIAMSAVLAGSGMVVAGS